MDLRHVLGLGEDELPDPERPLEYRGRALGPEASAEATRIITDGSPVLKIRFLEPKEGAPPYLSLEHHSAGRAELIIPTNDGEPWPTALEVAFVRALSVAQDGELERINDGQDRVYLCPPAFPESCLSLGEAISKPLAGPLTLSSRCTTLMLTGVSDSRLNERVSKAFSRSFKTSPLKYRFVEVYRVLESVFLKEAFDQFKSLFFSAPNIAVAKIAQTMQSEIEQMVGIAEESPGPFEGIQAVFELLRNENNRFAWGVKRSVEKKHKDKASRSKAASGACQLYAVRCAIVHAGEKDMVFDEYSDGDETLERIMPYVEFAALAAVGATPV